MKTKFLFLPGILVVSYILSMPSNGFGDLVTFDDILNARPGTNYPASIPSGYHGLGWVNFYAEAPIWSNGFFYGVVSPSNAAVNGGGQPAEIDALGTNFNFFSAYLTGAWMSNLNIEVEGFNGAKEIYDTIVVASATNPTLFTFNYLDIDRLYFNSYGGQDAGLPGGGPGEEFVMDDFLFDFVPEPSSLLLTALAAVPLIAFLRRKRK
jgi:hypothetical protein